VLLVPDKEKTAPDAAPAAAVPGAGFGISLLQRLCFLVAGDICTASMFLCGTSIIANETSGFRLINLSVTC
jgi:hypothetical protein